MTSRDERLDLIRGASSLLVLFGHARNFLMVDASDVLHPPILTKLFYLLTSLHHPAVMVFFVLSGYFVGGSVLGAIKRGRFSWPNYGLARLSRLWVVILPALVLTLGIDLLGQHVSEGAYRGHFHSLFNSGPKVEVPADYGVATFLGNLGFLQTIHVPVFGTNGPLWSLAYEFWYYALFPLAVLAAPGSQATRGRQVFSIVVLAGLFWMLPTPLLLGGLIWLMGVLVWFVSRFDSVQRAAQGWLWKLSGGLLFVGALVGSKLVEFSGSDFVIGFTFAIWMPSLLGTWRKPGWWSRLSFGLSEISFSLYIIHFPIQFFMVSVFLEGRVFQPSAQGIGWFVAVNLVCVMVTVLFWWLFERRTNEVRQWIKGLMSKSPGKIPEEGPSI